MKFTGYAVKWNSLSAAMNGYTTISDEYKQFKEQFEIGAFTESLKANEQSFYISHNHNLFLGRTSDGTLELYEDSIGLKFNLNLPPGNELGRYLCMKIKKGAVQKMSVGFKNPIDMWTPFDGLTELRTITKADLTEVSAVDIPAFEDTDISIVEGPEK